MKLMQHAIAAKLLKTHFGILNEGANELEHIDFEDVLNDMTITEDGEHIAIDYECSAPIDDCDPRGPAVSVVMNLIMQICGVLYKEGYQPLAWPDEVPLGNRHAYHLGVTMYFRKV